MRLSGPGSFWLAALVFWCCFGCRQNNVAEASTVAAETGPGVLVTNTVASDTTIANRFSPPTGFESALVPEKSFAHYLRHFPLRPADAPVLLYNGQLKPSQDIHAAVLDISTGKRDLQQCADAVMRLRAEYLWAQERKADIHFNFTNGFRADFSRWQKGDRIRVKGNDVSWYAANQPTQTHQGLMQYLTMVFSYAGTLSLEKELTARAWQNIQIGDVFIQGGSPGHAMLVVDLAQNAQTGQWAVLLAQSYMPAQDMHIVHNLQDTQNSPWFIFDENTTSINTPEWRFYPGDLRSFD